MLQGKTIENKRKRVSVDIVTNPLVAFKKLAKPTVDSFKVIEENLIIIKRKNRNIYLNKPIYLGFTVLELSKMKIYDFHYNTMLSLYSPSICRLCFTDTDSFLYYIQTENLYQDLEKIQDELDTSDYPPSHPLYSTKNKKVLGKWKDEMNSETMIEFVGLKAKMYSFLTEKGDEKKVGKGIKKNKLNELRFSHYKNVLESHEKIYVNQTLIRSQNHSVKTITQRKLALSSFDDKRYIVDGIKTLAHGHYSQNL